MLEFIEKFYNLSINKYLILYFCHDTWIQIHNKDFFGHSSQTSSFTKYIFLQEKNYFATIVNELSGSKWF